MPRKMTKTKILLGLRQLRETLEVETGGLTESQVLLLSDVCQVLGLCDAETYYVVGDAFAWFVDVPISYRINGNGNGLGPTAVTGEAPGSPNVGAVGLGIERTRLPQVRRVFTGNGQHWETVTEEAA